MPRRTGRRGTWFGLYQDTPQEATHTQAAAQLLASLRPGRFADGAEIGPPTTPRLQLPHEERPTSRSFRLDGDRSLETPQKRRARAALRDHELVAAGLALFFATFSAADLDERGRLPRAAYLQLQLKLMKALYPPADFDAAAARELARREYAAAFGRAAAVTRADFEASLFQTVDVWTEDIQASSYAVFLCKLYMRVTLALDDEQRRVFAPLWSIRPGGAPRRGSSSLSLSERPRPAQPRLEPVATRAKRRAPDAGPGAAAAAAARQPPAKRQPMRLGGGGVGGDELTVTGGTAARRGSLPGLSAVMTAAAARASRRRSMQHAQLAPLAQTASTSPAKSLAASASAPALGPSRAAQLEAQASLRRLASESPMLVARAGLRATAAPTAQQQPQRNASPDLAVPEQRAGAVSVPPPATVGGLGVEEAGWPGGAATV